MYRCHIWGAKVAGFGLRVSCEHNFTPFSELGSFAHTGEHERGQRASPGPCLAPTRPWEAAWPGPARREPPRGRSEPLAARRGSSRACPGWGPYPASKSINKAHESPWGRPGLGFTEAEWVAGERRAWEEAAR